MALFSTSASVQLSNLRNLLAGFARARAGPPILHRPIAREADPKNINYFRKECH